MTKTLIVNYRSMTVGGIETYIYDLVKYIISINGRVIWFCDSQPVVADSFKDLMLSNQVERVTTKTRGLHWFKHDPILFDKNEQIVMLSFTPFDMAKALTLRNEYRDYVIQCFYVVANFTGRSYYLEQYFSGTTNRIIRKRMKKILRSWDKKSYIRFFSKKHILCYEENYCIEIKNHESKLLKPIYKSKGFDLEIAKKRAKRDNFNLITVGRFDFPHKGYILGLIRAYVRLKENYPQLTLTIIGHGKDENKVREEIRTLPKNVREEIYLEGEISPDSLGKYFDKAHMNISVAGAVRKGAMCGLLSMPARHYCYDCQVYGFLPQSKSKNLSADPGEEVDYYIEKAINMKDEEYIKLCKSSYESMKIENEEPLYFFKTKNKCYSNSKYDREILFIKIVGYLAKIKTYLNRINMKYNVMRREGKNDE